MACIAIVEPGGNRVVSLTMAAPLRTLLSAWHSGALATRALVDTSSDWPLRFDRIYVAGKGRWRSYRPHQLPAKYR